MELTDSYFWAAVGIAALATYTTRLLPFILLRSKKAYQSRWLSFFRDNMPLAIITTLLIYSLKDAKWAENFAYKEIAAIAAVWLSYLWLKNPLLSIVLGVGIYMLLIRI